MKNLKLLAILALSISLNLIPEIKAQNLVPNPGFEEYINNPQAGADGVNESIAWFNLGKSTDFFHRTYGPISGIPDNFRGYQEPASGDGCAGLINWPEGPKEYMAVQLIEALEADVIYEVSLQVNLSDACQYASDDIGVAFLTDEPNAETIRDAVYHVKNTEGQMIRDTMGWTRVQGSYLATGGETYLVIGNFYRDRDTDREIINEGGLPWVYFYIDDVVVKPCLDQSVEQTRIDTTVCEGISIQLRGLPDVETYYWEGIAINQGIEIESPGTYVINNFTQCDNVQQIYTVKMPDCDCGMQIPSIQLVGNQLQVTTSFNVQTYQLNLFDASGRLILRTSSTDLDKIQLPHLSAIYFWQAKLSCLNEEDMIFQKTVGGKAIIQNW